MNLNVLPVIESARGPCLLDGVEVRTLGDDERDEAFNLNTVSVPNSWRGFLPEPENGLTFLPMRPRTGGWMTEVGKYTLVYSQEYGLEKLNNEVVEG